MLTRHARALAAAALLVVGPASAPVGAKPPDLPLPARDTCDDERPIRGIYDSEASRRSLAEILNCLADRELSQRDNIAPVQAAGRVNEASAAAGIGAALGLGADPVDTEAAAPGAGGIAIALGLDARAILDMARIAVALGLDEMPIPNLAGIGSGLGLEVAGTTPRIAFALGLGGETPDCPGVSNIVFGLGICDSPFHNGRLSTAAIGTSLVSPLSASCWPAFSWEDGDRQRAAQAHSAQRLFEIGRACEQRGDWAMARSCYEEATRLCPSSEYAAAALARIDRLRMARGNSQRSGGAEEAEPNQTPDLIHESRSDLRRIQESRKMYNLGSRYQGKGDWSNAHRCFEESHMICPACRYGQQAMERMLYIEHLKAQNRLDGAEEQEPRAERRGTMSDSDFQRREEAHGLYQLGERCRRNGDATMAYGFYQESHQASPDSYYGQMAIQRMYEIERHRGPRGSGVEEQEEARSDAPTAEYRGFARWMSSR
jgi:tetratricopeptide (TPR) repeat protein